MASFVSECGVDGDASADECEEEDTGSDLEGFIVDSGDDEEDGIGFHARVDNEEDGEPPCKRTKHHAGHDEPKEEEDEEEKKKEMTDKAWKKKYEKHRLFYVQYTGAVQWAVPFTMDQCCGLFGLTGTAAPDRVRVKYRHLCRVLHPDKNQCPDANAQFQVLQHAYNRITGNAGSSSEPPPKPQKQSAKQRDAEPPPPPPSRPVHEVKVQLDMAELFETTHRTVGAVLQRMTKGALKSVHRMFTIPIPAGMPNCTPITTILGAGDYDSDRGAHGDIRFVSDILRNSRVTRLGHNLEMECTVKLHQVLNPNFRLKLCYLGREEKVRLPATAWHGQRLVFPDRGLPVYDAAKKESVALGSLYVKLKVTRPLANSCTGGVIRTIATKCVYQ